MERSPFSLRAFLWRPIWAGIKALAILWLGVLVVLSLLETSLVFRPAKATQTWVPPPIAEIQDVDLKTANGVATHAWWLPHDTSERTVLYLHGNAGNLSYRGDSIVKLRALLDTAVLIVDYPGYGKSAGSPSEAGCVQAAEAAHDWLTGVQNRDAKKLVLYGASLGGGVAGELATRRPHHALVLLKTFTSAPDVGADMFPFLPIRWVMRTRFDTLSKLEKITTPVFVAHGDRDQVVPYRHGEKLYAAAREPKAFFRIPGAQHNDPLPEAFFRELGAFLDKHP